MTKLMGKSPSKIQGGEDVDVPYVYNQQMEADRKAETIQAVESHAFFQSL